MIKYIIFDWGGVFTHGHLLKDFANNLSEKCERDKVEIEKIFREAEFPYETGQIIPEFFWDEFRKKLEIHLTKEEIQSIFLNSYVINDRMLELAKKMKKKYKLILLTNNYEDLFDFIKENYKLEQYFDHMFSSSKIKDKKPNKETFKFVIDKLKINPEEAIFVDDKEKNVIGAQKIGLKTIHFSGLDGFKKMLSLVNCT
ncbi:MAG: HAD family phosphatase [Candidatus Moranbacteria bacterium]|nr:HAD family phosphatase [Candidatus Moranbacteria bacterium]